MQVIHTDQIISVLVFFGLLGLLWFLVRVNRTNLSVKLGAIKRISVQEVGAVTQSDKVMIVKIDQSEFVIFKSKGCTPVVIPIRQAEIVE